MVLSRQVTLSLRHVRKHFRELEADGYPAEEYGIDPRQAKVEDAQAELAEAGYPNGEGFPEVEITYANT